MRIGVSLGQLQTEDLGGGYTFEINFIESLLRFAVNHTFYIYYSASKSLPYTDTNLVKFRKIDLNKKHKKVVFFKIKKSCYLLKDAIKDDNIDVVYFLAPFYQHVSVPIFTTVWDLGHRSITPFPEVSANGNFIARESLYSTFLPMSSRIIVGNSAGKDEISKYYNIDSNRVILNPLPTPAYVYNTLSDESILQKLHIKKSSYFYYPAQFWAHKNHIRILKAVDILKNKGVNVKVVFSGSDKGNEPYIKEQVRKFVLDENIIFAGFLNTSEVVALYKNAIALIYASLLGPDNLPPLEAMALKCPVIVSDIPGHRIQLKDSVSYFDPYNEFQLAELMENFLSGVVPETKLRNAEVLAKSYSSEKYISNIIKMFDDFASTLECFKI